MKRTHTRRGVMALMAALALIGAGLAPHAAWADGDKGKKVPIIIKEPVITPDPTPAPPPKKK